MTRRKFVALASAGAVAVAASGSAFAFAGDTAPCYAADDTSESGASGSSAKSGSSNTSGESDLSNVEANGPGTDYANYPEFKGERDAQGFYIITEQAAGCRLCCDLAYRVNRNVKIELPAGDYRAGLVATSNLIYLDKGATLTVIGAPGLYEKPGLPGIALPSKSSLFFSGGGSVKATGGRAGYGNYGKSAQNPWQKDDMMYSGKGGDGSAGGGGAGAGIGTAGSRGGLGGKGGEETSARCDTRDAADISGHNGENGQAAPCPDLPGKLCIGDSANVAAEGGLAGLVTCMGGSEGSSIKITHGVTKHLTGRSGGGGSGGAGGVADGFGTGGIGAGGGGGGGSAGCIWLARVAWSSDDPPSGAGGGGGQRGNLAQSDGSKGNGERSTRGTHDHCGGGWGGSGGEGQTKANTPQFDGSAYVTILNTNNRDVWQTVSLPRWDSSKKQNARVVKDYSDFADIEGSKGWYIRNKRDNLDGKGGASSDLATIAGVTTVSQVKLLLTEAKYLPSRVGAKFMGWALNNKMLCEVTAQGISFDVEMLKANNLVTMTSATDGFWMCPVVTHFTAVWKEGSFDIVYHANGGTFVDKAGTVRENVTVSGFRKGQAVSLPNKDKVGEYTLKVPSSMAETSPLIGWTKKVDSEGLPVIGYSVYAPNTRCYLLNNKDKDDVVHLYAVWKSDGSVVFATE